MKGYLFVQIGTDGDVATIFLPLAGDVVVLGTFRRGTFRNLIRDLGHVAIVTGELNAVERNHLRSRDFIYFFDFCSVR